MKIAEQEISDLLVSLPTICEGKAAFAQRSVYIGAVGFEDRCLEFIRRIPSLEREDALQVVGLKYRPKNTRNKLAEFGRLLTQKGVRHRIWIDYDRYDPEPFRENFAPVHAFLNGARAVIVDISGMSRFLILLVLQELENTQSKVDIVYAEAGKYFPTKARFEKERPDLPRATPDFLTLDVYKVLSTSSLSSVSMQGYPVVLVAFPTFNHRELMALLNEMSPQHLISLEGMPHLERDHWRLDAVRWINRRLDEVISNDRIEVSTFDYKATLEALVRVYGKYGDTHRILVAPTGSKLQTIAIYLFKQMYPDVQIVYPVTTGYLPEYTKRSKQLWKIECVDFDQMIARVRNFRHAKVDALRRRIEERLGSDS